MTQKPEQINSQAVRDLQEIVNIGLALSNEQDLGTILEMIVDASRALTGADAGTLYILDNIEHCLRFQILQNDTIHTRINTVREPDAPIPAPVPLYINGAPNNGNVSSHVALTGENINIPDVYAAKGFNFTGAKDYDAISGYRSTSMLVIPMRDHKNDIIGVLQLLNARQTPKGQVTSFSERDEVLVSSLASQAAVVLTNFRMKSAMEKDLEEIRRLRQSEAELGQKLKKAYVETEEANADLKGALARVKTVRRIWVAFIGLLLLTAGWIKWQGVGYSSLSDLRTLITPRQKSASETPDNRKVATTLVNQDNVTSSITLVGQLAPLDQKVLISPCSGKIIEKNFLDGQMVTAGEQLMKIDTTELQTRIRQARSTFIKVQKVLDELQGWESGRQVSQAKMNQARQKSILASLKRKVEEANLMFKKGIIPGIELESAREAYENQSLNVRMAQEEIANLIAQGGPEQCNIAKLELENARVELAELEDQLARATVTTPVDGIVLLPESGNQRKQNLKSIEVGATVQSGEALVVIGDLSGLTVHSKVDEVNVSKLSIGLPVQVTGDAFPGILLEGWISAISCQAIGGGEGRASGGGAPTFDATVTIDQLTPEQAQAIRIGMTATLRVVVYENPDALIVPISAVDSNFGSHQVFRREGTLFTPVPVSVGVTTLEKVEILSGLEANDEIALFPDEVIR
ncbi:MAG: hypothetical protein CVV64_14195 [Candidatus Wallbacteria bacterium HGW-Wallbacteria-1]|jgi:multidrug efflux pump subunit AcrA (membrane-fusion protein)|uniref:GAF domain-containing protein n=1 Tax=Candidatus Wallbacteria bacterium HGW-Wallbacteria-1 TaxID=2013854 RepID=A0A2N1PM58_9BACT|nr:MAG: hypothetical protein CVV64_14195 [Candidatus Wallbacteria bacterium HGW-Wallbacteria-1]